MLIRCSVCKERRILVGKELKFAPSYLDFVCSASCVKRKIRSFPLVGIQEVHKWLSRYNLKRQKDPRNGETYSKRLDMWFASRPEADVAEVFLEWGEVVYYEPVVFYLRPGYLIPDFILPLRRLIVEVKGIWSLGQREKVQRFLEDNPGTNYLLISKLVYGDFAKLRKKI